MDDFGARRLVAAIIEQAIHDRRLALSLNAIDEEGEILRKLKSPEVELIMNLQPFFNGEGLESGLESAGFEIDASAIRRKSCERIKGRERG